MTSDMWQIRSDLVLEHEDHALVECIVCVCVCVCDEGKQIRRNAMIILMKILPDITWTHIKQTIHAAGTTKILYWLHLNLGPQLCNW